MSDVLHFVHLGWRYSHVICGFVGLLLFWIPVFAVKGSRFHIRVGRAFVWCAAYVGTTGLVSSVWAILQPLSFSSGRLAQLSAVEQRFWIEEYRFLFSILAFLSLAILCGVVFGVRVVRTRKEHERLPSALLVALEGAFGVVSMGLLLYGAWNLILAFTGQHWLRETETGRYWIPAILGFLGITSVYSDLHYIFHPRPTPMAWWYKHMDNMLGTGIGFHTAFLVFGMHRLFNVQLEPPWALLPWVLPTALGLPAIALWKRHYQRRFGELAGCTKLIAGSGSATPVADVKEEKLVVDDAEIVRTK